MRYNRAEEVIHMALKALRLKAGYASQQTLASATGLSQTVISEYELGKKLPGYMALRALKTALGCSWDDLLGWDVPSGDKAAS